MTLSTGWLVDELVLRVPELRELYAEHLQDNGEILPHVLFWDFTQSIVSAYQGELSPPLDWRTAIEFIESAFGVVDEYAQGVISASFLSSLPYPGEPGAGIIEQLGPVLREELAIARGPSSESAS
ncbi:DUF7674 family protein [Streptosporangium subroseum]|uniref:DUF7674 family protein n=1 Tax=Streptosporangium subroseum TaxID=106412 RepID=UPI003B8311B3